MIILLTNDDGIYAPGLMALHDSLTGLGELWIVAPANQQSGMSHAFSVFSPLRMRQVSLNGSIYGHAVSGTPADAVKLALRSLLPERPALVVSGINHGENSGVNVLYSGTVAGAMEGAIVGIPSIAISLCWQEKQDYSAAARFARHITEQVLRNGLPLGTILNVNVPAVSQDLIRGIKVVRQAESCYEEIIEKRVDPRQQSYYWIGGSIKIHGDDPETDTIAIRENYIAVTPIQARMTDERMISVIKDWKLE